ncbi:MAG TPA: hypothetical protein IAA61_04875 [Candidatus Ornithomonoglobus merdipullorum]|uniref:Uncharacterized protein n=1 Tax=Candidatus Ornithomonoglobus merdipullorum TaxID=2840895 RepID=A0A9D1MB57_9FIRM|nr:hypothetical protein [Candidatus Ornithomonoglobus merdipullorum]
MRQYKAPEMKIATFDKEDIIKTSVVVRALNDESESRGFSLQAILGGETE